MGQCCSCCHNKNEGRSVARKGQHGSRYNAVSKPGSHRDIGASESELVHFPENRNAKHDTMQRYISQQLEQGEVSGESFISVSVRSDMDIDAVTSPRDVSLSFSGCVPQIGRYSSTPKQHTLAALPASAVHKLKPGSSNLVKRLENINHDEKIEPFSYEAVGGEQFKLRKKGYLRTKEKAPSNGSLYELVQADLYKTNNKHWHIVRRLQLPEMCEYKLDSSELDAAGYPPILVLHILMPMYPVQLFFPQTDGANCSFVYFFRLPPGFNPEAHSAPEVKMIAQVRNPVEWYNSGKISKTELRLINSYNAKPVLMRPCMQFYRGKNYLEIDFDLHNFSYVARKGLEGYIDRLQPAVWEHGICIEGRNDSELPEVLLAGLRGYYWDFSQVTPFPVPELLRQLPKDGSELVTWDAAGEHDEVRAALATGNLSVEVASLDPGYTSDTELSDDREGRTSGTCLNIHTGGAASGGDADEDDHVCSESFISAQSSSDHSFHAVEKIRAAVGLVNTQLSQPL